ncbi:MAG: hypothetical protein H7A37_08655 [Chlamydiales bacterium]|nr:hypothetical protein [Chlamydiales bacterium]
MQVSSENDLSLLEQLPRELLGKILAQLPSKVDEVDILAPMRCMCNLTRTSKTMYWIVHDTYITNLFLRALVDQYQSIPKLFAETLDTVATRISLWDHIIKNKYDETYRAIQGMYSFASRVLQEAKDEGLDINYSLDCDEVPSPNPYEFQTLTGFLLYCSWSPNHIATPFGAIELCTSGMYSVLPSVSVSEVFIKRLNATFESPTIDWLGDKEGIYYEIINPIDDSDKIRKIDRSEFKQIDEIEIQKRKGSNNLIVAASAGQYTFYKIQQVSGKTLPIPTYHTSSETELRPAMIKDIWNLLKSALGNESVSNNNTDQKPFNEGNLLFRNIISDYESILSSEVLSAPRIALQRYEGREN